MSSISLSRSNSPRSPADIRSSYNFHEDYSYSKDAPTLPPYTPYDFKDLGSVKIPTKHKERISRSISSRHSSSRGSLDKKSTYQDIDSKTSLYGLSKTDHADTDKIQKEKYRYKKYPASSYKPKKYSPRGTYGDNSYVTNLTDNRGQYTPSPSYGLYPGDTGVNYETSNLNDDT